MSRHATDPEKLIDYLYRETDSRVAKSVEAHLESCEEDQERVESWRETMRCLDAWVLDAETRKRPVGVSRAFGVCVPLLKIAAVATVFVGLGFLWGRKQEPDPVQLATLERSMEARFANEMEAARIEWAARSEEMERNLLLASGATVHQEAQALAERALQQLARHESRNETLALLLPPEEQERYRKKKAEREQRALAASQEAARTQNLVQQIISRAAKRAAGGPH